MSRRRRSIEDADADDESGDEGDWSTEGEEDDEVDNKNEESNVGDVKSEESNNIDVEVVHVENLTLQEGDSIGKECDERQYEYENIPSQNDVYLRTRVSEVHKESQSDSMRT